MLAWAFTVALGGIFPISWMCCEQSAQQGSEIRKVESVGESCRRSEKEGKKKAEGKASGGRKKGRQTD